jgi:hypothetical protein
MSWLFSQVLVEEYLGDISSDGEQSVQLSGNPIQQAYCAPDKMTAFSRLSRFGMTYKPLTEDRGEELLTLYLEAFPAKTSLPQEKEQGLKETEAGCGKKWHGSFTKYDLNSCLWRTHQCSLLGDLEPFLETWPRWGLMRSGECWEQQTLAHRTSETEYGFWPTPCATDYKGSGKMGDLRDRLDYAVERGRTKSKDYTWPTPRSCSAMAATITPESAWNEKRWSSNLETVVGRRLWPKPRTKGMCGGTGGWDLLKKNTTIEEARQMGAGNGGKLNPMWVEWLMGWPLGWTDLRPLGTDKFQKWQDEHGRH